MSAFDGREIAVIDTETTGLAPAAGHVVVEVAGVLVAEGEIRESWASLVAPGRPIPPDATAVHGITDAMVAGQPTPAQAARRLREWCGGRPLAFHNASFDLPFLEAWMSAERQPPLTAPVLDTLGLARGLFGPGGNSLGALARRLGLQRETAHRALGDALTTARALLALARRWEAERGACSLAELAAASQDLARTRPGVAGR